MMNQVLQAFRSWDERQQAINQINPSKNDQKTVNRLKLDHLRECRHRLSVSAGAGERPFLPLLDNAIKRVEQEVYPNILLRLISRLKDRFVDRPAFLQHMAQCKQDNITMLRVQLAKAGLNNFSGDLEQQLRSGNTINMGCQLDQQRRMDIALHFVKDADDLFELKHIHAEIGEKNHRFQLSEWPGLDMVRIKNLLEGRAIKQHYTDLGGSPNSRWLELAPDGQVKQYLKDYEFDPEKLLEGQLIHNKQAIIGQLEKGNLARLPGGYLQADPANSAITYLDHNREQVTASQFIGAQKAEAVVKKLAPAVPARKIRKGIKHA